jgi:hypothetical protein
MVMWETPRNIAILVATVGTVIGVLAGVLGYKLGSQPSTIIVHLDAPLTLTAPK